MELRGSSQEEGERKPRLPLAKPAAASPLCLLGAAGVTVLDQVADPQCANAEGCLPLSSSSTETCGCSFQVWKGTNEGRSVKLFGEADALVCYRYVSQAFSCLIWTFTPVPQAFPWDIVRDEWDKGRDLSPVCDFCLKSVINTKTLGKEAGRFLCLTCS